MPAVRGWGWGLAARWTIIYTVDRALYLLPFELLGISAYRLTAPLLDGAFPLFASLFGVDLDPGWYSDEMGRAISMLYDVLLAFVIGLAWLLLDRRRKHEVFISESARLMARYTLAAMLFYYGGEKFVGDQGGWAYEANELIPPYGETTGFAAMMSWLSHSIIYAWFAGWAEAGAGILMFSRRFTTLAAWLALADMGMVWLINQSYWGSAAFAPLHFVPPAAFLVAPHLKRSLDFFVLNRPTVMPFVRLNVPAWSRRAALAVKIVVVPWLIYSELIGSVWHGVAVRTETPLQGLYRVEHFERNGIFEPLAYEFPDRWRDVAFGPPSRSTVVIRQVNDTNVRFLIDWPEGGAEEREDYTLRGRARAARRKAQYLAPVEGDIPLGMRHVYRRGESSGPSEKGEVGSLHYMRTSPGEVTLEGTVAGDTLKMRLRKIVVDKLPYFEFRWKPI